MVQSSASTPAAYLDELGPGRREAVSRLRETLLEHLPDGFEETMSYGMIGYVVPHSLYPAGYHCNPELPLPFLNLASQKQYVALYHMGLYADDGLLAWFREAWEARAPAKLDMGKSCIRFRNTEHIPYALVGELAEKMTPQDWIDRYEASIRR